MEREPHHYTSGSTVLSGARAAIRRVLSVFLEHLGGVGMSLTRKGEQGTPPVGGAPERAPRPETLPAEKALRKASVLERHQTKERQQEHQPGSGSDLKERDPTIPCQKSRAITGPVKKAPGGALVPEVPGRGSVEESASAGTSASAEEGR